MCPSAFLLEKTPFFFTYFLINLNIIFTWSGLYNAYQATTLIPHTLTSHCPHKILRSFSFSADTLCTITGTPLPHYLLPLTFTLEQSFNQHINHSTFVLILYELFICRVTSNFDIFCRIMDTGANAAAETYMACDSHSTARSRYVRNPLSPGLCECGLPPTLLTSWTNQNPGRRFWRCPGPQVRHS